MNHMLVSSLRLLVASSVPSLKREVSKSRNTNRHWPKKPQQIPAPDGARDPEKGKTSKTESFGYYHSSPAKCHRTNQRFHPQTTSGDKHPKAPPRWCQRRQGKEPGRSLPDGHKTSPHLHPLHTHAHRGGRVRNQNFHHCQVARRPSSEQEVSGVMWDK